MVPFPDTHLQDACGSTADRRQLIQAQGLQGRLTQALLVSSALQKRQSQPQQRTMQARHVVVDVPNEPVRSPKIRLAEQGRQAVHHGPYLASVRCRQRAVGQGQLQVRARPGKGLAGQRAYQLLRVGDAQT